MAATTTTKRSDHQTSSMVATTTAERDKSKPCCVDIQQARDNECVSCLLSTFRDRLLESSSVHLLSIVGRKATPDELSRLPTQVGPAWHGFIARVASQYNPTLLPVLKTMNGGVLDVGTSLIYTSTGDIPLTSQRLLATYSFGDLVNVNPLVRQLVDMASYRNDFEPLRAIMHCPELKECVISHAQDVGAVQALSWMEAQGEVIDAQKVYERMLSELRSGDYMKGNALNLTNDGKYISPPELFVYWALKRNVKPTTPATRRMVTLMTARGHVMRTVLNCHGIYTTTPVNIGIQSLIIQYCACML